MSSFFRFFARKEKFQVTGLEGNTVSGTPREFRGSNVSFQGTGNQLVIGANVRLKDVRICFPGNNGTFVIGAGCGLRGFFNIQSQCAITIGEESKFNKGVAFVAAEGKSITIGKRCLFANTRFRTSDFHSVVDRKSGQRLNPAKDIVVGDQVWIAEDCRVYKGVNIGTGSIIGAGSLVLKDVPEYSLAAGVPARVIKQDITWNAKLLAMPDEAVAPSAEEEEE